MCSYVKNISYQSSIILFFCIFLSSCVYFNTFYNVKNSFKEATEIVDNDSSKKYSDTPQLSNLAKKKLYESISSSNVIINKHSDSEYIDDAIYYIGRSYFILNELI